jgi:tRNA dimethylallyltransferase
LNHSTPNKFIINLAGPTASGKTSLAVTLAQYFGAEIFSADSRQVYREMNIGTAKPDEEQLEKIRHHFIGHISIQQRYSAGIYMNELKMALESYFASKNIAIVAGGTGLYFRALMEGLADFPDITEEAQKTVNEGYRSGGLAWLREQILLLDPILECEMDLQNARRMLRALELMRTIGKPLSQIRAMYEKEALPYPSVNIYLDVPRDQLYHRINSRVDAMMSQGLFEEVKGLLPYRDIPALETVGYTELFNVIDGISDLEEATELIKRNTRRYAKRQMTWFRKYGDWHFFSPQDIEGMIACIKNSVYTAEQV